MKARTLLDDAIERNAQDLAVDSLGKLVDELHAKARDVNYPPAQEALRQAADLISEKRKEIQRGE